ncbi:cytochrome P450 9e2-like [Odontomachus brunneus]|uniref:cytochrome P450 9e2-like n=1 Tax=Odontomachus brunneus TaxID=486640 RepID=UPI0013F28A96|nr:cytochrome P450 9e2-like [Odontomachus brunneus]
MLSPAFTSSKMKYMLKLISDYTIDFVKFLTQLPMELRVIETKDIFMRYTNDVIATYAFGVSVDSVQDLKNLFYIYGREASTFNIVTLLKTVMFKQLPWIARLVRLKFIKQKIINFFRDFVETTIKIRNAQGIVRPNIMQLMIENRDEKESKLTIEDMMSQAFIFFFDAFKSSSTLMCFAAHEIAVDKDMRKRLQNEIDQVLEDTNGQLSYEATNSMEYLDMLNETLRKYPSFLKTDRLCQRDFELSPTLRGRKPYTVKKDDIVWLPIYALHNDPKYFKEPEKFDL